MSTMAPSSPRLPSPPPSAEIPAGISIDYGAYSEHLAEAALYRINSKRRVHPGTRSKDMASGPPLVNLSELDSPFQLQEHLAALHYHHTEGATKPVTRSIATLLAQPPPSVDRIVWLYELCRFLIVQCNDLIVGFLFDTPPCSAATCPEMRASEWQFLCAVHETPKNCCAIDYCCHTLDWAANVITDPKLFPSRFITMSESHMTTPGMKTLINVFRRLHRIFAHAWFLHRNVFWAVEDPSGLYILFKAVCNVYNLLPGDTYKLPPEAEGLLPQSAPADAEQTIDRKVSGPITIIKQIATSETPDAPQTAEEGERPSSRAGNRASTTYSGTPSTGSTVNTVHEDEENTSNQLSEDMDDNVSVLHDAEILSSDDDSSEEGDISLQSESAEVSLKDKDLAKQKSPSRAKPSQVPIPVELAKPVFNDDMTVIAGEPGPTRAKNSSPRPGSGSGAISLPPSKLPKKASPRPPKASPRIASPATLASPSAIPPPMHAASGGTVIALEPTKTAATESSAQSAAETPDEEEPTTAVNTNETGAEASESSEEEPSEAAVPEEPKESNMDVETKDEPAPTVDDTPEKEQDDSPQEKADGTEPEPEDTSNADAGSPADKPEAVDQQQQLPPPQQQQQARTDEKNNNKKKRRKSKAKSKADNKSAAMSE
ncbi:hypothetical protein BROUX41_001534 [Berkeleyomyces rouxiae]|uniref:uncharacterized protein n=1 Tax=Berkeleyomyces rouxiae TaxID=2035830 RepID=UPI003B7A0E6D